MTLQEKQYHSRHLLLEGFTEEHLQKLSSAHVVLVGAGGLGCPVALYLAGAGIGRITIIDYDKVDITNLPRQILYNYTDIGKSKSMMAAEYLRQKNPFITIDSIHQKLTVSNVLDVFKNADLVVDGSDNFTTRYLVNDACVILNKPFVSGSVVGYEGQVSVFNFNGGPTYRCLFPEKPLPGETPSCSSAGVLNTLTGWVGTLMAQETIKTITGIGNIVSGRMVVLNGLTGSITEFAFSRGDYFPTKLEESSEFCTENGYEVISTKTLAEMYQSGAKIALVDVREDWEIEDKSGNLINIPLAEIPTRYHELNQPLIAFTCSKGERSRLAAQWMVENLPGREVYVIDND